MATKAVSFVTVNDPAFTPDTTRDHVAVSDAAAVTGLAAVVLSAMTTRMFPAAAGVHANDVSVVS
ncbi:MAG TPA: hypothetical protein VGG23_01890, partial [Acidimicrobiales bacterium]